MAKFEHRALELTGSMPVAYTAFSKQLFYFRAQIQKYVLEQGAVPINPFMNFDYFLSDSIDRDVIRIANNNLVARADELWVFGLVSDGVLAEMKQCQKTGMPIKFFKIMDSHSIIELPEKDIEFEPDIAHLQTTWSDPL